MTFWVSGIISITSAGLITCICAGLKVQDPICRSISFACSTQVDAFWSNSIQKNGTGRNTTSTLSTAREPSSADCGCFCAARAQPPLNSTSLMTRTKECGSLGVGGWYSYLRRPAQKTSVATAIRMPGMPNAQRGPYQVSTLGMHSEAKKEPRLMDQ